MTSGAVAVKTGDHSCAIMASRRVKCWGYNSDGQLGTGTTRSSRVPVFVTGIDGGTSRLAAGMYSTCAVVRGAA